MAKNIRWQIPFVSTIDKTKYRVDIYDEGTFTPVELTAGPTPFVTNEDASDDFFHPVRTQTGTLQVCTKLPSGGMITLNDLLPENNISRPVRLVSIATNNTETIEWQGFISCEAYNQDYIGIPQILDIPVISVLEAMDSVQLDQSRSSGLVLVRAALKTAIDEMMLQSGMNFYDYVNYSQTSYHILNKYIDQTVLFEQKEYNNENSTTYIVSGLSVKNAIERIAQYMGWVVREKGTTIYFIRLGDDIYTSYVVYENFGNSSAFSQREDYVTNNLATDVAYRGTGHQRSIAAGAKSVEVVAKLDTSDFDLKIPKFPFGDISNLEWQNGIKYKSSTFKYLYIQINYNNAAYNNNAYSYHKGEITRTGDSSYTANYLGIGTKAEFLARLSLFPHASDQKYINANPQVAGAILIRYAIEDEQTDTHSLKEGLYCPLLPGQNGQDYPIYKMWTVKKHTFFNGKFIISAAMLFNALYRYNSINQQIMSDNVGDGYIACPGEEMTFVFRVGNKYWNGTNWVSSRSTFQIPLVDTGFDYEIEADQHLSGDVELEVMAGVSVTHVNTLYEVIFNSLEVNFQLNEDYQASDRRENHYFRLLGTNFRDEISVSTEIASNLNNQPCPSLIMDDITTPMTVMDYVVSGGTESRRPEVDLLDRLAIYYGSARQRLELEVEHPTAAPLPLLKLNGINDGKVYLPLAESRDWREETCTISCFETLETPSES